MGIFRRLEVWGTAPAFSGWVLGGMGICFFAAAVNTMAGWLYVLSGLCLALLAIGAVLPARSLGGLSVKRRLIEPVNAGDELVVEVEVFNSTSQPKLMLQVRDLLPFVLGDPVQMAIEVIPAAGSYRWVYAHRTVRRGVYRWHTVELLTGAPLGLFWSRRLQPAPAMAVVYPQVLPLTNCPLVNEIGQENSLQGDPRGQPLYSATVGLTRSLRPYRSGDPIRLIHWRTSARYGELRVRELEQVVSGQEIIIALDGGTNWQEDDFEQAVIAAASMYFYAHRKMNVRLWTALTGLVQGTQVVMDALAATHPTEEVITQLPTHPLIWLTANSLSLSSLPLGSRWLLWQNTSEIVNRDQRGILIQSDQPLLNQLQAECFAQV
jgi:uncharacterized protein (DUF58 family)